MTNFCRFPLLNKELLSKWLVSMKRDNWKPKATDRICSKHFEDCYIRKYASSVQLRENAVPTLFDFPRHLQAKKSTRRVLVHNVIAPQSADCSELPAIESVSSEKNASVVKILQEQHNYALMVSPRGIKRKYELLSRRNKLSVSC